MENFFAVKEYYVNEFSAIQDWFGNRGIPLANGDLKEWAIDGHFIYFTCSESAPEEILPCEGDNNCMVCLFHSDCYECYEEMDYDFSPFANKINVKPFDIKKMHTEPRDIQ